MKLSIPSAIFLLLCFALSAPAETPWDTRQLQSEFYSEGASFGDIDGDGIGDLVSGPFWWKGPAFDERRAFYEAAPVDVKKYSDNFFSHVLDVNGDGRNDVLVIGFPGREARVYLNPGAVTANTQWPAAVIAGQVGHEAPALVNLIPGGLPELICSREKSYGYYEAGDDPTTPWTWRAISEDGTAVKPFGHGLGVGDVNGDGRLDVIDRESWWAHPDKPANGQLWKKHRWLLGTPGRGGAQIHVHDVDGDGLNDIVTSLNGHGFGLAWFKQKKNGAGKHLFEPHIIMGESSVQNPFGVAFSQLHAVELKDIDGDGRRDIVTGKRWYAHGGKDPGGLQEAVLYWFQNTQQADGSVEFVPHLIHNDSGIGVEVLVTDLNGDTRLDIVSASKKGVTIHLQNDALAVASRESSLWKVPGGRPDDNFATSHPPREAARAMEVPEGFHVDLIAGEPDLVQPIAMCFDARGRLWVVEGMSYPQRQPEGEGKDRILIFEDTDGNGDFDSRKVFADKLNLVSGIEVGFGGVWIGAAPHLLFIADADGNDVPDSKPKVLLDGWHYEDTHETLNSFTWGPDGWLYGCHGVFTHSLVGKPGTPEAERQPINAGVWRYHPTRHEFEVFAWGTSNPWGVDFNENGDWFVSACVIPHFFHLSQGGRYFRQAGQHFNPHVYADIATVADHVHYGDGTFSSMKADGKVDRALQKEKAADTSAVGGGHAHCGLTIYDADIFPEEYRGRFFFHNLHGHRIVTETAEREGSGYIVRHRPDFALAKDHAHVGTAVLLGPDGAIYAADWHDPQTCHHRDPDIWDRSNGRVFRIRYGDPVSPSTKLPDMSDRELVAQLTHANRFFARQAQRLLQERAAAGSLEKEVVAELLASLAAVNRPRSLRLRALWTQRTCGLIGKRDLTAALDDPEPFVRAWAVQFLAEAKGYLPPDAYEKISALATNDPSADVRRYIASALQRLPHEQRWDLVAALASHPVDARDRNLPLLTWYGFEPLVGEDPARALMLSDRSTVPLLSEFARRRATVTPEGRDALLARTVRAGDDNEFMTRAREFLDAVEGVPDLEKPDSWAAVAAFGEDSSNEAVKTVVLALGARFGDSKAFPFWRKLLVNRKAPVPARTRALRLLTLGGDPELGPIAAALLTEPALRKAALDALPAYTDEAAAARVVAILPKLPLNLRNDAINLVASRPETANVLLEAVADGKVASSLVSPVLLRQMRQLKNADVNRRIDSIWGKVTAAPPDLALRIRHWKRALTPERLARADKSHGRLVFTQTCGTCHQLFGEGIALGPDLTGSNRGNLDYVLENVLAPNSVVSKDYFLTVFTLKDGRLISGMIRNENDAIIEVALPGGTTSTVAVADIEKRQTLEQSLMIPGLFDAIPEDDVANLVAYLASPAQVPMPGAGAPAASAPTAASNDPLEGEALLAGAVASAGQLRNQSMTSFKAAEWSGNRQLFWIGAKPGATLKLAVPAEKSGVFDLSLHLTRAKDYGTIAIRPEGLPAREIDLYHPNVTLAGPVTWKNVKLEAGKALPLTIEITGRNPKSLERFMVGIDRVGLAASAEPAKQKAAKQKAAKQKAAKPGPRPTADAPKAQLSGASRSSPNILFAISDDQSWPHASAYGTTWVQTPAFDRVAAEGILFNNAYTPNAKCAPSRACILTGRNTWQMEEACNHMNNFPPKFTTWMEALQASGRFTTGHTAKGWAPGVANDTDGKPRQLTGQGWNGKKAKPPAGGISGNDYAANFAAFLDAADAGKPWAFWFGATEPHRRYEFGSGVAKGGKKLADIDEVPPFWPDNETIRNDMLDYAFEIEHFDSHLGRMLDLLEKRGELENTLVIVTADNGMPFPRIKGQEYELSNHLPLAIMWPNGIKNPGRTVDDYVSFIDFAPTILEAAGLRPKKAGMQPITGRSLKEIFNSKASGRVIAARDHVIFGKERHDVGRPNDEGYPIRGIVKDGFLYLQNFETGRWPAGNPETGYLNCDGSPTKTQILDLRRSGENDAFWNQAFGKRPGVEFYRISADRYCVDNLAANPEFTAKKDALRKQLVSELKAQEDPRILGNGHVFDDYRFGFPEWDNFYENWKSGDAPATRWVNPTDYEK